MSRVLASEYLEARSAGYESGETLDPVLRDLRHSSKQDELGIDDVLFWLAFMAGSDWERKYRGPRYNDVTTSVTPHMDVLA